ncbi:MAG: DUF4321 domain-containing protein [Clostridia bacterium]|nr:DUF4321 domain-containing protein [Clostridia bacterium]
MARRKKNNWILILFILGGLVIGGILGEITSEIDSLWWLGYGKQFGFSHPVSIDLNILRLTFSLIVKINIASIVGAIIAMALYKKL